MNRFLLYLCGTLLVSTLFLPVKAQEQEQQIKVGKMIKESYYNKWDKDFFCTYYIVSDAKKINRFIKKGHWQFVPDRRYHPYFDKTRPMIRTCFMNSLRAVLTKEQIDTLNVQGEESYIFMSDFYIFIKSRKRFVKLKMSGRTDRLLSKNQIYKILRLYTKCKLPVHPVAGLLKEKEYYVAGASIDKIE